MAKLRLTLTTGFSRDEADALAKTLQRYVDVDKAEFFFRRAIGLPEIIQLLGDWTIWVAVFGVPMAGFFARLGQRAADGLWDAVREWLKRDEAKPLKDVSSALAGLIREKGMSAQIVIGLDIPGPHFGTAIVIHETEPEKIAYAIARFVIVAEKISSIVQRERSQRGVAFSVRCQSPVSTKVG